VINLLSDLKTDDLINNLREFSWEAAEIMLYYSQEIKNIVKTLKDKGISEGREHKKIFRPWGSYFSFAKAINLHFKKIKVNSRKSLSLQKHNHRMSIVS